MASGICQGQECALQFSSLFLCRAKKPNPAPKHNPSLSRVFAHVSFLWSSPFVSKVRPSQIPNKLFSCLPGLQTTSTAGDSCHLATVEPENRSQCHIQVYFHALKQIPPKTLTLAIFRRYRITTLPLIPSIIHQLVNAPEFQTTDFSSVVTVGSAAAYLPPQLNEKFISMLPKDVAMSEGQAILSIFSWLFSPPRIIVRLWHVRGCTYN